MVFPPISFGLEAFAFSKPRILRSFLIEAGFLPQMVERVCFRLCGKLLGSVLCLGIFVSSPWVKWIQLKQLYKNENPRGAISCFFFGCIPFISFYLKDIFIFWSQTSWENLYQVIQTVRTSRNHLRIFSKLTALENPSVEERFHKCPIEMVCFQCLPTRSCKNFHKDPRVTSHCKHIMGS